MNSQIIPSLIGAAASVFVGVLTFLGVVITNSRANSRVSKQLEVSDAVTESKIEELTREVREHNNFARRIPVVEEQIKVINHRLHDLEDYHK